MIRLKSGAHEGSSGSIRAPQRMRADERTTSEQERTGPRASAAAGERPGQEGPGRSRRAAIGRVESRVEPHQWSNISHGGGSRRRERARSRLKVYAKRKKCANSEESHQTLKDVFFTAADHRPLARAHDEPQLGE